MILGYLYEKEEDSKGTWFKCYVPEGLKSDYLEKAQRDDGLWEIGLEIYDPRQISNEQRRLLYALFRDIGGYTGYVVDEVKEILKVKFMVDCRKGLFSLSNVDMTTAREFIEHTLAFMFEYDIPLSPKYRYWQKRLITIYIYAWCIANVQCVAKKQTYTMWMLLVWGEIEPKSTIPSTD